MALGREGQLPHAADAASDSLEEMLRAGRSGTALLFIVIGGDVCAAFVLNDVHFSWWFGDGKVGRVRFVFIVVD